MAWVELEPILDNKFGQFSSGIDKSIREAVTSRRPGGYLIRGNVIAEKQRNVVHQPFFRAFISWAGSDGLPNLCDLIGFDRLWEAAKVLARPERPEIDLVADGERAASWLIGALRDNRCLPPISVTPVKIWYGDTYRVEAVRANIGEGIIDIGILFPRGHILNRRHISGTSSNSWGFCPNSVLKVKGGVLGFEMPKLSDVPMFSGKAIATFSEVYRILKVCVTGCNSQLGCAMSYPEENARIVKDLVRRNMTPPSIDCLLVLSSALAFAGHCPRYNAGECRFNLE